MAGYIRWVEIFKVWVERDRMGIPLSGVEYNNDSLIKKIILKKIYWDYYHGGCYDSMLCFRFNNKQLKFYQMCK